jgi:hypothetical protein
VVTLELEGVRLVGGTRRKPHVEVDFRVSGHLLGVVLPIQTPFQGSFEETVRIAQLQVERMAKELAELAARPLCPR